MGGEGKAPFNLVPIFLAGFESFYTSLHTLVPIVCTTGLVHKFERAPDVVISDIFLVDVLHMVRKVSKRRVPVLSWNPANLGPLMRLIGPEELGGIGDIRAKAVESAERTGKDYKEAEIEIFHPQKGEVVKGPGMPPMYDYEYHPNASVGGIVEIQISLHKSAFMMLHGCDGMVCASSLAFESEACKATKEWLAKTNRPVYVVGPLLPDSVLLDGTSDLHLSTNDLATIAFLDRVYETSGLHSLLYISFGTMFWPPNNLIWRVIEIILDRDIPLLLAYDELRLGKMPEHIAKKFKTSNKVLTSAWTPQQDILCHQATGWFLTHCGQNSILEAIVQGVPLIAWPIDAEQPPNAAYITLTLSIAYELLEGRSGLGLKPMHRGITPRGTLEALEEEVQVILDKAYGEDGKVKRENIRILRDKMREDLREGGQSVAELENFIRDYMDVAENS
ncbi:hypothetical protein Clacol_006916 [Clathrus columnatus]|uniref:UDP-Glycosyltransferase/glycogen phosphorylase n=1 Tax=Clathrus columnatus TaxID=1419009 RepID=A0AAV5AG95_9AGAM|nr:hypothetical protein Clacol_006916 [Clathrus columnatus]